MDALDEAMTSWSEAPLSEALLGEITNGRSKFAEGESCKASTSWSETRRVERPKEFVKLPPRLDDLEAWPRLSVRRCR
jgi:hypothetical protein